MITFIFCIIVHTVCFFAVGTTPAWSPAWETAILVEVLLYFPVFAAGAIIREKAKARKERERLLRFKRRQAIIRRQAEQRQHPLSQQQSR